MMDLECLGDFSSLYEKKDEAIKDENE